MGNQGGKAGNKGGNVGNQGGNAGNGVGMMGMQGMWRMGWECGESG